MPEPTLSDDRLARLERRTEWPLAAAAIIFLIAYAWPILQPDLESGYRHAFAAIDTAVWVVFVAEYVTRLVLARRRWDWFWRHLLDLAVVALPMFRPLRLLRLVVLLRILNRRAADTLRGRIAVYVTGLTLLLVFSGSLAVLSAERGAPGSNITSFGDAVWWSVVTISTVGYGDYYPVTVTGRLVAVVLMLGGIALLSSVTAGLASFIVSAARDGETDTGVEARTDESDAATLSRADVAELVAEIKHLRTLIETRGVADEA